MSWFCWQKSLSAPWKPLGLQDFWELSDKGIGDALSAVKADWSSAATGQTSRPEGTAFQQENKGFSMRSYLYCIKGSSLYRNRPFWFSVNKFFLCHNTSLQKQAALDTKFLPPDCSSFQWSKSLGCSGVDGMQFLNGKVQLNEKIQLNNRFVVFYNSGILSYSRKCHTVFMACSEVIDWVWRVLLHKSCVLWEPQRIDEIRYHS